MSEAIIEKLERFTRLAFLRRRRALRDEERVELDGLLTRLSETVEGFHPPSRRRRVSEAVTGSSSERPAPDEPAQDNDPFEEKTDPLSQSTGSGEDLPPNVQSVDLSHRRSKYTPMKQAVFLEDYYGADFVPDQTGELPKVIVDAEGQPMPATGDIQWFLRTGSLEPAQEKPNGSASPLPSTKEAPAPRAPSAVAETPGRRQAAIVHLKAGGTLRGRPQSWPPGEALELESPQGTRSITRDEVLAIFATGAEAVSLGPELGVAVTLANDKVLEGRTRDYVKGAQAFTLVPEPRRPGVDVVWIPAHAVKAINRTK
ncbi:MAG: hypothetical protein AAF851_12315 [Myxococcota bacterium]